MAPAKYNERKPGELIVLIASLSRDDPAFGDVKLNKLLFFSDFLAYTNLGHPTTGAEYQKLDPRPRAPDWLAGRALDADDAAGADAALRAVARNEATRDDLAAADQQLADWRRRSPRTRAIGDYVHGRIDRAEGIADLNVVLRGLL